MRQPSLLALLALLIDSSGGMSQQGHSIGYDCNGLKWASMARESGCMGGTGNGGQSTAINNNTNTINCRICPSMYCAKNCPNTHGQELQEIYY